MTTEQQVTAYHLTAKQGVASDAIWYEGVDQLLYGGAAGGGKSGFLRAIAYHAAQMFPGGRIAIFRDNYTQLRKTQVTAWWREMSRLGYEVKRHWHETQAEWHFANPYAMNPGDQAEDTIVEFLHLDQSIGAEKWLSAEWTMLLVDESTQMSEEDLALLYSRVRTTDQQRELWSQLANEREQQLRDQCAELGYDPTPRDIARARSDWHPIGVYATNPGGKSHAYHVREFIEPSKQVGGSGCAFDKTTTLEIPGMGEVDVTTKRMFLQSFLTDNPHLDPKAYAATLAHLPKRRREQMLSGDWDYFEGKVFGELRENVHLVDAHWIWPAGIPPQYAPRLAGYDHGNQAPAAAEWASMDEEGNYILGYLEYYAPGPNAQHIRELRARMTLDGFYEIQFEADPQMWRKRQGHDRIWSTADEFLYAGEPPEDAYEQAVARQGGIRLHQSHAIRDVAKDVVTRMLDPDPDRIFPDWHPLRGTYGAPRLFICKQAGNLWREINGIKYVDGSTEEMVKEDDHAFDAGYRVVVGMEQAVMVHRAQQARRHVTQIGYA